MATYYVTRYATTTGLMVVEGEISEQTSNMLVVHKEGQMASYFHGRDFHASLEEARADVVQRVDKELATLKTRIVKLDALRHALQQPSWRDKLLATTEPGVLASIVPAEPKQLPTAKRSTPPPPPPKRKT